MSKFNLAFKSFLTSRILHNFFSRSYFGTSFSTYEATTYKPVIRGYPNTPEFRVYFKSSCCCGAIISPFHDIPLYVTEFSERKKNVYHMIVEIPRWTTAKMQIATTEILNPIKQDIIRGRLRYVDNCFPHHGYMWNYGALPQTWECPNVIEHTTKCGGDNDPIDALEIGGKIQPVGAVIQVKVLGSLGIIDEGEMDWKLLVIDVEDPLASKLNDVNDIEKMMPGYLKSSVKWFQIYKVPQGKAENLAAFEGRPRDVEFSLNLLEETHKQWHQLSQNQVENTTGLALERTMDPDSPFRVDLKKAEVIVNATPNCAGKPVPVDPFLNKWYFGCEMKKRIP